MTKVTPIQNPGVVPEGKNPLKKEAQKLFNLLKEIYDIPANAKSFDAWSKLEKPKKPDDTCMIITAQTILQQFNKAKSGDFLPLQYIVGSWLLKDAPQNKKAQKDAAYELLKNEFGESEANKILAGKLSAE